MTTVTPSMTQLRFKDLQRFGIVKTYPTLQDWIDKKGFPPGRMLGDNTRSWSEHEILEWVNSRPPGGTPGPLRGAALARKRRKEGSR
jgi:predicted DNA-binding transcriptional regulator AlpA